MSDIEHYYTGQVETPLRDGTRIILSVPLRKILSPDQEEVPLVSVLEPEGCIGLRTVPCWEQYVNRLMPHRNASMEARALLNLIAASSFQTKCDRQGRIRLKDVLLQRAKILTNSEREVHVVVVGYFDLIQVWSTTEWDNFQKKTKEIASSSFTKLINPEKGDLGKNFDDDLK